MSEVATIYTVLEAVNRKSMVPAFALKQATKNHV